MCSFSTFPFDRDRNSSTYSHLPSISISTEGVERTCVIVLPAAAFLSLCDRTPDIHGMSRGGGLRRTSLVDFIGWGEKSQNQSCQAWITGVCEELKATLFHAALFMNVCEKRQQSCATSTRCNTTLTQQQAVFVSCKLCKQDLQQSMMLNRGSQRWLSEFYDMQALGSSSRIVIFDVWNPGNKMKLCIQCWYALPLFGRATAGCKHTHCFDYRSGWPAAQESAVHACGI